MNFTSFEGWDVNISWHPSQKLRDLEVISEHHNSYLANRWITMNRTSCGPINWRIRFIHQVHTSQNKNWSKASVHYALALVRRSNRHTMSWRQIDNRPSATTLVDSHTTWVLYGSYHATYILYYCNYKNNVPEMWGGKQPNGFFLISGFRRFTMITFHVVVRVSCRQFSWWFIVSQAIAFFWTKTKAWLFVAIVPRRSLWYWFGLWWVPFFHLTCSHGNSWNVF